jgi:hypothetical protein
MCRDMVPEMVRTAPDPTPYSGGRECGLAEFRMGRQTEVIVGGEVDHLFAVEARLGSALRLEDAEALVSAFGAPLFELIVQVRQWIAHGCSQTISR